MDGKMLVKDMIIAIENKDIKIAQIADKYSYSTRTIQKKIKNLGYEWDADSSKYNFTGDNEFITKTMDEVFNKSKKVSKKTNKVKGEINSEVASTIDSNNDINVNINRNIKTNIGTNSKNDSDNIDRLLAGKKVKKKYIGFYLDSDVLAVIDNVDSGIKSELVNECLRRVFKEKGLL